MAYEMCGKKRFHHLKGYFSISPAVTECNSVGRVDVRYQNEACDDR